MSEFWIYNLKVGVCLVVFYLFFRLCMSRETCHRINRILVLAGVALSFVLPLAVVTLYREIPVGPEEKIAVEDIPVMTVADTAGNGEIPWTAILGVCMLLGSAVMLVRALWMLREVWKVIARGRKEMLADGTVLVRMPFGVTPFGWGRYIVLAEEDLERSGGMIITHERAHCRLHHTADLLFMEVMGLLQWFNPAMWLLKRDLRELHEYEADAAVLHSGVDAREYQLLLIKKAVGGRWYSVANCFNHSKLKNRITMMMQKKSSKWAGVKSLLLLPLVGCAVGAFAETVYVTVGDKGTKNISITAENRLDSEAMLRPEKSGEEPGRPKTALIVVDGEIMASDFKLSDIDSGKIASLTVLKGKSATDKYGDKGKDGAIEVTLRKEEVKSFAGNSDKNRLVVVDGEIMASDFKLSDIDSGKIASLTVLKGKSAMDKYGDKGKDGAIEVTLRKK